ncbi:MAG: sigma-70 family RNA polymerase sigma factor [Acidobacteriota bacterium]
MIPPTMQPAAVRTYLTETEPMDENADRRDVRRVLDGDLEAFAGIVERWQTPMVNLAWRYCRERGRAEDIAQDVFLRVFRGLKTWRGEGSFSTWLFAVAVNACRRATKTGPPPLLPLDEAPEPAGWHDPAMGLALRERDNAVRREVLRLPARYRDVLLLFYFFDMDVNRVAEVLSSPVGTIKARLSRGRALLRRRLGRDATVRSLVEASP